MCLCSNTPDSNEWFIVGLQQSLIMSWSFESETHLKQDREPQETENWSDGKNVILSMMSIKRAWADIVFYDQAQGLIAKWLRINLHNNWV